MQKNKQGFTIIELLVVVVIIAVLSAITFVAYTSVQTDARDTERDTKVKTIADALEKYYEENGEYPGCSAMTQPGNQVSNILEQLDPNNLLTPNSPSGTTNAITCSDLSTDSSGADSFGYVGDGSSTCSTGQACMQYTLQYREEGTGNIISLNSQHMTQVGITGAPTLTATVTSTTQVNLSWTAIANASSYKIQRATNSDFSANLVELSASGTAASMTGLTPGTTYYFHVIPTSQINEGEWSNTVNTTTSISSPVAPTVTAAMSGTNAVGTSSAVSCASGTPQYQLRYRSQNTTTLGSWSAWSAWSPTQRTLSQGAAEGYRYDFQSWARCQGTNITSAASALSNIASIVRPINTPSAPTYLNPSMFISLQSAYVDYASYCPGGTSMVNGTFHSRDWLGGNWGPYAFHYYDSWENVDRMYKPVEYWGQYRCQTAYATSPYSPESYNVIQVQDPRYP